MGAKNRRSSHVELVEKAGIFFTLEDCMGEARPLLTWLRMSNVAPGTAPATLPLLLEHAHADHEMAALRQAVKSKAAAAVRLCFEALERGLLQHFNSEERELFPAYAAVDADDVNRLTQEHARFRQLLASGHARAARGAFTGDELHELTIALTLHHAHEETGLYRWARGKTNPSLPQDSLELVTWT